MKLNLLKPLKRILAALGGERSEDKNLVAVVDKIADMVEEGSSSGNGGNGGVFLIDLVVNPESEHQGEDFSLNVTASDIFDAVNSGKVVCAMSNIPIPGHTSEYSEYYVTANQSLFLYLAAEYTAEAMSSYNYPKFAFHFAGGDSFEDSILFYSNSLDDYPINDSYWEPPENAD